VLTRFRSAGRGPGAGSGSLAGVQARVRLAGRVRARGRPAEARRLAGLKERLQSLTPREREVFELVITGRQSKIIAADLNLSVMTVKVHRSHVMRKMGAKSLFDLARIANSLGMPAQD